MILTFEVVSKSFPVAVKLSPVRDKLPVIDVLESINVFTVAICALEPATEIESVIVVF